MNINKIVAVGLCAVVFGVMPTIANAQYEDYSFGDTPSYDFSDFGSSGYENYSFGDTPDYNFSDYGNSRYENYSFGDTPSYDFSDYGYGGSGYENYGYGDTPDHNFSEYEYNPNGATEFEYNPNGATEYEYNPNCVGCATEYEYNPNGATEYEYNPGCGTGCATEYEYNPGCGCYESTYGGSFGGGFGGSFGGGFGGGFKMPSFGGMSIVPPSYPTPPRPTPTPHYPQPTPPRPTPTTPSTPININNVNTNTNTNTNVNTNVTTVTPVTPGPIVQYVYPYSQQYPTYPTQAPYCVITASNQYNYGNGMISLKWSSSGATSAYITPGLGQVAPNGSTTLYGYNNTVYTMTVSGPNGSYTCHTQSYVNPIVPVSPYVSLTQIPYTGLALGPIGNALYWMGLISVAVAGAYLLVYYKGGMLALAGQTLSASIARRSQEEDASPVEAPHQEKVAALAHLPVQETTTRDAMKIVRSEDGTPRLVISRA